MESEGRLLGGGDGGAACRGMGVRQVHKKGEAVGRESSVTKA